jgi:hypothetical protein
MNVRTASTPPRKPVRSPAAPGFVDLVAEMTPAMNAPTIIIPPPIVASEFGSQFRTTDTGNDANAPISANCHTVEGVRTRDGETIFVSKSYLRSFIHFVGANNRGF